MNYDHIKTLKEKVEHVLQEVPESRNSDITLTIEIWRRFFASKVRIYDDRDIPSSRDEPNYLKEREYILLKDLYTLPREDSVKRARAWFQNTKKLYLPTDWLVARHRGIQIDEWRVAMGYPTKDTAGSGSPEYTPPSKQAKIDKF